MYVSMFSGVERDKLTVAECPGRALVHLVFVQAEGASVQGAYLVHTCSALGLFIKCWENNFLLYIDTRLAFPASLIVIVMGQGIRRDTDSLWWE